MILNNTQITWKLKEGIVLKYGPAPESYEENSSLSESGSVNEVPESETFIQDEVQSAELIMPVENTPNPVSSSPDVKEDKAVSGDTPKSNVEQSYPESVNHKLVNSSNSCPVVDGIAVHIPPSGVSLGARWQSLPYRLRAKRADVFVDFQSSVD